MFGADTARVADARHETARENAARMMREWKIADAADLPDDMAADGALFVIGAVVPKGGAR